MKFDVFIMFLHVNWKKSRRWCWTQKLTLSIVR